jgi:hypothetical protein
VIAEAHVRYPGFTRYHSGRPSLRHASHQGRIHNASPAQWHG